MWRVNQTSDNQILPNKRLGAFAADPCGTRLRTNPLAKGRSPERAASVKVNRNLTRPHAASRNLTNIALAVMKGCSRQPASLNTLHCLLGCDFIEECVSTVSSHRSHSWLSVSSAKRRSPHRRMGE